MSEGYMCNTKRTEGKPLKTKAICLSDAPDTKPCVSVAEADRLPDLDEEVVG
jgi:hypothetical protein